MYVRLIQTYKTFTKINSYVEHDQRTICIYIVQRSKQIIALTPNKFLL